MKNGRRNYTHEEAQTILTDWLAKKGMTDTKFQIWLELRGVSVTRQYCHALVHDALTPGPKFKLIFKEITGITLVDGLVEKP